MIQHLLEHLLLTPTDDANDLVTTGDPLVTLYTLDGKFDIVYKKPANEQTVTLDLDDPDSGVSLDRANYPQNTGVAITIDDMAFNVDPTSPRMCGSSLTAAAPHVTRMQTTPEMLPRSPQLRLPPKMQRLDAADKAKMDKPIS